MTVKYADKQQTFYIGTNGKGFKIRSSITNPIEISIGFAEKLAESILELINHSKGNQIHLAVCKKCGYTADKLYDDICKSCYNACLQRCQKWIK